MSCTTRKSSFLNAASAWVRSGSLNSGFSPTTYMDFMRPSSIAVTISVMTRPCSLGSGWLLQAFSNLEIVSSLNT